MTLHCYQCTPYTRARARFPSETFAVRIRLLSVRSPEWRKIRFSFGYTTRVKIVFAKRWPLRDRTADLCAIKTIEILALSEYAVILCPSKYAKKKMKKNSIFIKKFSYRLTNRRFKIDRSKSVPTQHLPLNWLLLIYHFMALKSHRTRPQLIILADRRSHTSSPYQN